MSVYIFEIITSHNIKVSKMEVRFGLFAAYYSHTSAKLKFSAISCKIPIMSAWSPDSTRRIR